jgi:hypothetical protein
MKKIYLLLSSFLVVGALSAQNYAATNPNPIKKSKPSTAKAGSLLFSNTNINFTTSGIASTEFGANPVGMRLTNTADDFSVPVGGGWTIDSVYAEGFTNSTTTPDSIRTIIYSDNAGVPGTIISNQMVVNPDLVAASIIPIKLPNSVSLTGGKYWLSIVGSYTLGDTISTTRWNWSTGPTVKSDEFHLQDPANQFGGFSWAAASVLGLSDRSAYFDIFGVVDSSGCGSIDVNDLTIDSTSKTTASVTISSQPTGNWLVEYGVSGFTLGTGTNILVPPFSTTDTNFTISGLTAGTVYDLYIKDSCGVGVSGLNVGPFVYKTIVSAPFTESFNSLVLPAAWSSFSTTGELWSFTPISIGHSAPTDHTTGTGGFAAVDDSETPSSTDVTLETELIDVSSLTTAELSFWLYSDAEDFSGVLVAGDNNATITVDFYDGANWNANIFTNTGNTFSSGTTVGWQQFFVNLGSYTITGPVAFRFIVDEDHSGGFDDDISLDDISVLEARPVGLFENTNSDLAFEVYPNPAKGIVNIAFNAKNIGGKVQVQILDITGKIVLENNFTAGKMINKKLNVSNLSSGMYFVRTIQNSQMQTKKLLID